MVVPIRELSNIHFSISATIPQLFTMARISSNIDMNINNNIIKERSNSSSKVSSRESFVMIDTSRMQHGEE